MEDNSCINCGECICLSCKNCDICRCNRCEDRFIVKCESNIYNYILEEG
jgi:hypothetical protein